jgi:predicted nucleic acid-binding Zn finger protein
MLKLYHFSNSDFKRYIKTSFLGKNDYSKQSVRESDINRSFFYLGKGREYFLQGARFCYTAIIEQSKIYDLIKDKKNLKTICLNFSDILKNVKNLGYYGIKGNNGFNVVELFKPIKYIDKRVI